MTNHDPGRHLEYLRQSLSQDKKPIGFFLAAGCPLSVKDPADGSPLIPDIKGLTAWISNELVGNVDYQKLLSEIDLTDKSRENIEDILSFLRGLLVVSMGGEVRGLSHSKLQDLEKIICKKLVDRINKELPEETTYHIICKWISSIDRDIPIEVFTTNYDLLMEEAFEGLEVPYFDGFVGSKRSFFDLRAIEDGKIPVHWTRLWKIHGSINWFQDTLSGKSRVFRSSEISCYPHLSALIFPSHLKYEQSRKMPYLALIDQLNKFIRQKSSLLIICGYSFNDEHLNDTIINASKANPSSMILALLYGTYLNADLTPHYPKAYKIAEERHNFNVWTDDRAIIGTSLGEWTKIKDIDDNVILQFVEDIPATPNKRLVKLGDFTKFTQFLKSLIGPEATKKLFGDD